LINEHQKYISRHFRPILTPKQRAKLALYQPFMDISHLHYFDDALSSHFLENNCFSIYSTAEKALGS
jgi:hypothetical protein